MGRFSRGDPGAFSTKQVAVRVTPAEHAVMNAMAREMGMPLAEMFRRALDHYAGTVPEAGAALARAEATATGEGAGGVSSQTRT